MIFLFVTVVTEFKFLRVTLRRHTILRRPSSAPTKTGFHIATHDALAVTLMFEAPGPLNTELE